MKTIIWKPFWNYEKEEAWLNEKCSQGLALVDYTWMRYVFEDCVPGEYIFRIEMLEDTYIKSGSRAYINFVESSGVKFIAGYGRWAYFRKKSSDGPFDIYSDNASKLKHYQRVRNFWLLLAIAEALIAFPNIANGILHQRDSLDFVFTFNFVIGCILVAISVLFFILAGSYNKKIKKLKEEKEIME